MDLPATSCFFILMRKACDEEVDDSLFSSEMSFSLLTFFHFGLGGLTSGLSTVGLTFNFRFVVHMVLPDLFGGVSTGSAGVFSIISSPRFFCASVSALPISDKLSHRLVDDGRETC